MEDKKDLKPISWLACGVDDNDHHNNTDNKQMVLILDDLLSLSDFTLSPEEYKQRYEEHYNGRHIETAPPPVLSSIQENHNNPVEWLSCSIDDNPDITDKEPIAILETNDIKDFKLSPEEYKRQKEELEMKEKQRRETGRY